MPHPPYQWDVGNVSLCWEDLNLLVERTIHENGLSVCYTLIEDNQHKRDVFLRGFVKWDGCSDWHFGDEDECDVMAHFCGMNSIANFQGQDS